MGKTAFAAAVGVLSVSLYIVGYPYLALVGVVSTVLLLCLYKERVQEVDASNKAVFITGKPILTTYDVFENNSQSRIIFICKQQQQPFIQSCLYILVTGAFRLTDLSVYK